MADYPTLPWDNESSIIRDAGIRANVAEDGTVYTRFAYASDVRRIRAVHIISQADRDTLLTFYNARKADNQSFGLTLPGGVGSIAAARFMSALDGIDMKRPELTLGYRVTVDLIEIV